MDNFSLEQLLEVKVYVDKLIQSKTLNTAGEEDITPHGRTVVITGGSKVRATEVSGLAQDVDIVSSVKQVTHPKIKPEVRKWMQYLRENNIALKAPEISVYEVRRELIRLDNNKSINRLNRFISHSLTSYRGLIPHPLWVACACVLVAHPQTART